jgi:hypothetical protein
MILTGRVVSIALLACAALAACDDAPPPSSAPPGTPAAQPAKSGASLPAGMVSAVSSGKTSSAISVHFELGATPAVGMSMPVKVAIVPHRSFKYVRAIFTTPDGLQLADGRLYEMLRDVEAEQILQHQVTIQPTQDGIYLISVGLETESDEGNITRSFSIPVIVPAGAPAAAQG